MPSSRSRRSLPALFLAAVTVTGLAALVRCEGRPERPEERAAAPRLAEGLRVTPPAVAPRARPVPASSSPPRLAVLYVMDALRADHVGVYGGPEGISPTLDRLAASGLVFRQHRASAPNTLPSTKALFLGRPVVDRGGWALSAAAGSTLAERFRDAGYATGLFSGNGWIGPSKGMSRGFDHVAEEVVFEKDPAADVNTNAAAVHAAALRWLGSLPAGARAFLYLHTVHPHNPYSPPEPFHGRWTRGIPSQISGTTATLLGIRRRRIDAGLADRRRLRALYAASVAYNDAALADFLAALHDRVAPREFLLAVTSDHGEELFDHGGVLHGYTLYEEMIRIPLILSWPGTVEAGEVRALTGTADVLPILAELCRLERDEDGVEGRSLSELPAAPSGMEVHFAAAASVEGGIFSAQSRRFKLVWAPRKGANQGMGSGLGRTRDPEYLFDLRRDPGERHNLAGSAALEPAFLRARLLAWLEAHRGQKTAAAGDDAASEADTELRRRLRALGYVQ